LPNIANINQINTKTNNTLRIPVTESKIETTRIFNLILCVINLKGRKVLKSLKIFTAFKSISKYIKLILIKPSNNESIIEATTIKKSNSDQLSLR